MKITYLFLISILGVHLFILSQLQFTAWPEMVSFPYFINNDFVLYKDAIHAYPPLLVSALAILFKFFGYKLIILKLFGWGILLINDILIFLIVKKTTGNRLLPLFAVFFYCLLQPLLEGNMVWPDLAIIPFLLATFLMLLNKKYLYAGLAIGLACLTKQTGIFYLILSVLYLFLTQEKTKKILFFLVGSIILFLTLIVKLVTENSLMDFVNWTVIYPSSFWTKFPGYVQMAPTLREILLLGILVFPLIFIFHGGKSFLKDKLGLFLMASFVVGVIGVYPRFSFFHFQPALAFLVILYFYIYRFVKMKSIYFLFLVPIIIFLVNFQSLKFGEARFWARRDINLAKEIQNQSPDGKQIYLLGLNSNLYAFADRPPSKPWLDNFGWYLEIPGVQEEVIKSLSLDPPSKIFWRTPDTGNWYDLGVYQPKKITEWINKNYNMGVEIEKGIWEWSKK